MVNEDEKEGVVKYNLTLVKTPPLPLDLISELTRWRERMLTMEVIGQVPHRYGGLGFGNVSQRIALRSPTTEYASDNDEKIWTAIIRSTSDTEHQDTWGFVVTGTQTGGEQMPDGSCYSVVTHCDPLTNTVKAVGPINPSSECMTHWSVYTGMRDAEFIIHAHSPLIWRNAKRLKIPITDSSIPYGTPQMCDEVVRLLNEEREVADREYHSAGECKIFSMGGHLDGIVAFGKNGRETAERIIEYHERAERLELDDN